MLYKLIHSTYSREIQTIDLFRTSNIHFLSQLIIHIRPYHAASGELIYEMGDIATEVSFIIRGSVRITAFGLGGVGGKSRPDSYGNEMSPDGRALDDGTQNRKRSKNINYSLLGYSSSGGYFGDLEFVKKSTRIARYVATDSCSLIAISYEKLNEAIAMHPDAGNKFLAELKSRYENFQVVQRETFATNSPIAAAITSAATSSVPKLLSIFEPTVFIPSRYEESLIRPPPRPSSLSPFNGEPLRSLVPPEVSSHLRQDDVTISTSPIINQNVLTRNRRNTSSTSLILAKPKTSSSTTEYRRNSSASLSASRQRGASLSSYSSSDVPSSVSRHTLAVQRNRAQSIFQMLTETVYDTFEELNHPHSEYHSHNLNDDCIAGVKVDELWFDGKLLPADSEDFHFSDFGHSSMSRIKYLTIRENKEGEQLPSEYATDSISNNYIIHPKKIEKLLWDGLVGMLIVYSITVVPMQLAFSTFEENGRKHGLLVFDLFIDFMFFMDILLTFNTAYFSDSDDAYIAIRSKISSKYVQSWFLVDLITCIPFNILIEIATTSDNSDLRTLRLIRIIRLLRLVKLLKIVNFVRIFYRLEDLFNISPSAMSLIATLTQVIYTAHLICCMWWGSCTNLTALTWYDSTTQVYVPLRDASFQDQYVASLYWTVTTLTTVGYGDIVPINNHERVLAIFIMVIGATVFGYVVANMSTIIGNFNQLETKAADRLSEMTESMRERNCPDSLIMEITNHYKQVFNHNSMFDEDRILSCLPVRLRLELLFVQHKSILEKIPLFQYIKNVSLKLFLLRTMKANFVGVDRQILKEGARSEEVIFIISGKCLVCRLVKQPSPSTTPRALSKISNFSPLFLIGKGRRRGEKDRREGSKTDGTTACSTLQDNHFGDTKKIQPKINLNEKGVPVDGTLVPSSEEHMMDNITKNIRQHYECKHNTNAVRSNTDLRIDILNDNSNTDIDDDLSIGKRTIFQHSNSQEKVIEVIVDNSDELKQSESCSIKVDSAEKLSEEKIERARCNWLKVKSQLSRIASMSKTNVKGANRCAKPATVRVKKRSMKSINMLIDVNGHLERIPCDVEPLGTVTAGSFVGHMAMMQDRTHASSLVVTESCHYYTLHKKDIEGLLRDQPGLAVELQSALSSAIYEEAKLEEKKVRRNCKSNFLDDVKKEFLKKETAMLISRKKIFGKMTSSLSRTMKRKAKKEEDYRGSKIEREWSGKCDRGFKTIYSDREEDIQRGISPGITSMNIVKNAAITSSAIQSTSMNAPAAVDIHSSHASDAKEKVYCGVINGYDKSYVTDSINTEEGEGEWRIEGMSRNSSTEIMDGKIKNGPMPYNSAHGSIESAIDLGEGYGKVSGKSLGGISHASSTSGGNSIKAGKTNSFWPGIGENSQLSKKAKQQLADKIIKLDKLQAQYLALIDEYGSDVEQEATYTLKPNHSTKSSSTIPTRSSLTNIIRSHTSYIKSIRVNKNENKNDSSNYDRINETNGNNYHKVRTNNRNQDYSVNINHDNAGGSNLNNDDNDISYSKIYSEAVTSNMSSCDNDNGNDRNNDVAFQIRRRKGNDNKYIQNISRPITPSSGSLGGLELGCCKIEEDKECDTIGQTLPSSLSFVNIVASDPKRNESNISISQNSLITPSKITGSTDSVITIWGLKSKSKSTQLKSFHDTLRSSFIVPPVRQVIVNHKRKLIVRKKHRSYSDLLDIDSPSMKSMKEFHALADPRSIYSPRDFEYEKSVNSPQVVYPSSSSSSSQNSSTRTRKRRNSYPSKETDFGRKRISTEEII